MVEQRDLIKHVGTSESPVNGPDVEAAERFTRLPTAIPVVVAVATVGVVPETSVGLEGGDGD
jgi:hypothetical protein